jgi:hypothetical protein
MVSEILVVKCLEDLLKYQIIKFGIFKGKPCYNVVVISFAIISFLYSRFYVSFIKPSVVDGWVNLVIRQ